VQRDGRRVDENLFQQEVPVERQEHHCGACFSAVAEVAEARLMTKGHQTVWPAVHRDIMSVLHWRRAQNQSADGTARQHSAAATGGASQERRGRYFSQYPLEKQMPSEKGEVPYI